MAERDDPARAFEARFAEDPQMRFRAEARRNRLLGLWAAERLGLGGTAAEDYARGVIMSDFEEPGDDDVFRKLRADLAERGVGLPDADLRAQMRAMLSRAMAELSEEDV